tara:strand:- start:376 stop:690 length:315 start_codon:yes stop_codon:yes gene_type:complete
LTIKAGTLVRLSYAGWGSWKNDLGVVLSDTTPDYSTASERVTVIWLNNGKINDMLTAHLEIISETPDDSRKSTTAGTRGCLQSGHKREPECIPKKPQKETEPEG